jgi:hypothetical protein
MRVRFGAWGAERHRVRPRLPERECGGCHEVRPVKRISGRDVCLECQIAEYDIACGDQA